MMIEDIFRGDLLPYAAGFLAIYLVVYFASKKVFKDNQQIASIVSVCIALLTLWGATTQTTFMNDFSKLFANINDSMSTIIFFAIVGVSLVFILRGIKGKNSKINFLGFGIGIAVILLVTLPDFVSIYYFPDWAIGMTDLFVLLGGYICLWALFDSLNYRLIGFRNGEPEFRRRWDTMNFYFIALAVVLIVLVFIWKGIFSEGENFLEWISSPSVIIFSVVAIVLVLIALRYQMKKGNRI